nr:hypothetical protein GCM10025699_30410 [Microbacterium flavescens]
MVLRDVACPVAPTGQKDGNATGHRAGRRCARGAGGGGSEHAFRALYRAYVRPVYWLAYGLVGNAADAEDVTQETFLVAWRKLPGLELAGESLLPWLATVCRFQAANRIRRQKRDREHTAAAADETLPATVDVEEQVIGADLADRILQEVAGLSPLDRDIFRLCAAEGYAYQARR